MVTEMEATEITTKLTDKQSVHIKISNISRPCYTIHRVVHKN